MHIFPWASSECDLSAPPAHITLCSCSCLLFGLRDMHISLFKLEFLTQSSALGSWMKFLGGALGVICSSGGGERNREKQLSSKMDMLLRV